MESRERRRDQGPTPITREHLLGKVASPNWLSSYVYRLASVTGWGFHQIMWEIPYAAGLQILDADSFARGIPRVYLREDPTAHFDSLAEIESVFSKL